MQLWWIEIHFIDTPIFKDGIERVRIFEKLESSNGMSLNQIGIKTRKEVHETGDLHLAVHLWVYNENWEVLIQKRSASVQAYPGYLFISAGWHVALNETIQDAIVRELEEELGIKKRYEDMEMIHVDYENIRDTMHWVEWKNQEVAFVYLLKIEKKEKIVLQKEEVDWIIWMNIDEFKENIFSNQQESGFIPKSGEYYSSIIREISKYL